MAICIDSSAVIRGVRSTRCKVTLNTELAYRTAPCSVSRNICRRSDGQPLTILGVLTVEIWYTSGGADSCTWYIPSIFSSPLFTALFALLTFIFSWCCMQYPLVLQAWVIFQAINWLSFFLHRGTKGTPFGSKCDKTHTHNTQNTKVLHTARQTIINCLFGIIARQCIIYYSVGLLLGKELALLEMCNQLWNVLLNLRRWDR